MSAVRSYRRAGLEEIAAQDLRFPDRRALAERMAYLPAAMLELPPFAFGESAAPDALRQEAQIGRLALPAIPAWMLHDAMVHGSCGVITLDKRVLEETLAHLPLHAMPGAGWDAEGALRLPDLPSSATLPAAYHLMACNQESFYHWMVDAVARFDPALFAAIGTVQHAPGGAVLLVGHLDQFWKWETVQALVPDSIPRLALTMEGRAFARRLLFVPGLAGAGFSPHPALLRAFEAIAAGFGHRPEVRPWRRIYVARSDSRNRVLVNEAEVIALAERAGFTPVVLAEHAVHEQVRLFVEASHILAPHGAGLTNIGYCRPGTKLCELHMDFYLNWVFRRLAALRGMHYGCLVGTRHGAPSASVHTDSWRIDIDAVDAMLRDPRFIGE